MEDKGPLGWVPGPPRRGLSQAPAGRVRLSGELESAPPLAKRARIVSELAVHDCPHLSTRRARRRGDSAHHRRRTPQSLAPRAHLFLVDIDERTA